MKEVPAIALAVAYWLHMLATVVWIGGIFSLAILVVPSARRVLDAEAYARFLGGLQTRLQQVAWFSLIVLTGTGLFQMVAHPKYSGFLAITNTWAVAILIKHLVIGLMILSSAYVTWGLLPTLRRNAILQTAGRSIDAAQQARLLNRETTLLRLNLVLAVVILALTALARSS